MRERSPITDKQKKCRRKAKKAQTQTEETGNQRPKKSDRGGANSVTQKKNQTNLFTFANITELISGIHQFLHNKLIGKHFPVFMPKCSENPFSVF